MPDNTPHRIVALAAAETAEISRLTMQQNKYVRGWVAAKLELQRREWGYKPHTDWTETNNFAGAIVCPNTDKTLEYRDRIQIPELRATWMRSLANTLRRLAQDIREIKGTNTIYFIDKSEIPRVKLKQVTYTKIKVDYNPHKLEKTEQELQSRVTECTLIMT